MKLKIILMLLCLIAFLLSFVSCNGGGGSGGSSGVSVTPTGNALPQVSMGCNGNECL